MADKVTIPHQNYLGGDEESLKGFLRHNKLGEGSDFETAKIVSDGYSHKLFGADPTASIITDSFEGTTARQMLDQINFSELSGITPMEKAAAWTAAINSSGGMESLMEAMKEGPSSAKDFLDGVKKKVSDVNQLRRSNEFASQELGLNGLIPELELPKLDWQKQLILEALGHINEIGQLKTKKKKRLVRKEDGSIEKYEPMESYEQLILIPPVSFALPDFKVKLAGMDFDVPTGYDYEDVKQAILLAIDISGSMHGYQKQSYVQALLLHFMNGVKQNNTVLWVGKFERVLYDVTALTDESAAKEYYSKWKNDGGGNTEVGEVIKTFQQGIKSGKIGDYFLPSGLEPELVIINDGDDVVDPATPTTAPVHALILGKKNRDLKAVCVQSEGTYNEFMTTNEQNFPGL